MQDPSKRFGASLGALSGGRVGITGMCTYNLKLCMPIAIRYSAVRRQFGPTEQEEIPVLEYQLQVLIACWVKFHVLSSAGLFQNQRFQKILSGLLPVCQTVWIQIRTDILSVLILVQTVGKGYQQTTQNKRKYLYWNISYRYYCMLGNFFMFFVVC